MTFLAGNDSFLSHIAAINKEEHQLGKEGKLTPERIEEYEKERKKVKEEFGEYTSLENADFYTMVTPETFDNFFKPDSKHYHLWKETYNLIGEKVKGDFGTGVLKGLASCLDDYYWIIEEEKTNDTVWFTAVGSVEKYNK
ncbi:MAG: hypothetical protein MJ237_06190 [bacterium]|nr:hypothetical protein [bacterium]